MTTMMTPVSAAEHRAPRVVWADDAPWVRRLMADDLRAAGYDVVGEAGSLEESLGMVRRLRPDVAILDIRMPPTCTDEGIVAATTLRAEGSDVGILLLSEHVEAAVAAELVESCDGGVGYLLKSRVAGTSEVTHAIERIMGGQVVLDPVLVDQLFARTRARNPLARLSTAQLDVLRLVAEGYSNRGIAERLFIGHRTVESHVSAIFSELGINPDDQGNRRVLAVLTYLRYHGDASGTRFDGAGPDDLHPGRRNPMG